MVGRWMILSFWGLQRTFPPIFFFVFKDGHHFLGDPQLVEWRFLLQKYPVQRNPHPDILREDSYVIVKPMWKTYRSNLSRWPWISRAKFYWVHGLSRPSLWEVVLLCRGTFGFCISYVSFYASYHKLYQVWSNMGNQNLFRLFCRTCLILLTVI